jgi:hypothetical protein
VVEEVVDLMVDRKQRKRKVLETECSLQRLWKADLVTYFL